MKTTDYRPLKDEVSSRIRELITDGTYAAGSRLVERTIARDLDVSRVPVREALQVLVREGFAIERPTGGIAVRAYEEKDIDELFDVRAALEGLLVEQLAGTISTEGLEALRANLSEAASRISSGDTTGAIRANATFHDVLASAGRGTLVRQLLADIDLRMRWLLQQHSDPKPIHREHVALVDAIESGDVHRVRMLNDQHIQTSRKALDSLRANR